MSSSQILLLACILYVSYLLLSKNFLNSTSEFEPRKYFPISLLSLPNTSTHNITDSHTIEEKDDNNDDDEDDDDDDDEYEEDDDDEDDDGDDHNNSGKLPGKRDNERIALCICGTARSFHNELVHNNILDKVVLPLRAEHETDIFFIVRMEDDGAPTRPIAQTQENRTILAMKKFNATQIVQYSDMSEPSLNLNLSRYQERVDMTPVRMLSPYKCSYNPPKYIDLSHTLFRTKHCLNVVAEHERKNGFKYDWMYRIRTDIVYVNQMYLPRQLNRSQFYVGVWTPWDSKDFAPWWSERKNTTNVGNGALGDQMFAASRSVANKGFRAFDIVDDCEAYELPMPNIESSLKMYLVKHNIPYNQMNIMWYLIREGGPECKIMHFVELPNTTVSQRFEMCEKFSKEIEGKLLIP